MILRSMFAILREPCESSSLHGVPRIVSSKHLLIKVFWVLIVIGASILLGLQLTALFEDYNSYPTKTSIKVNYGPLAFPSVTLCNMNPVKLSKIDNLPNMSDILKESTTEATSGIIRPNQPGQKDGRNNEDGVTQDQSDVTGRDKHDWNRWKQDILISLRRIKQPLRLESGLTKTDFFIQAEFNEMEIPDENIRPTLSSEYGTCYSIFVDDSDTAGPQAGMKLTLFLDKDEYIEELSDSFGVKLVIHEKGTFPLPSEEGYVLNTGYQTEIGVSLRTIERLKYPYGDCNDGTEFRNNFGFDYSIPLCYALCLRDRTMNKCHCMPYSSPELMNEDVESDVCSAENKCAKDIKKELKRHPESCNCFCKCEESVYSTRFSSRRWPNPTHLRNNIYGTACSKNITNMNKVCLDIQQGKININDTAYKEYAENFVKAHIYFETLVYEVMTRFTKNCHRNFTFCLIFASKK